MAPPGVVPASVKLAEPCLIKLPTPVMEPWKLALELFCSSVMSPRPSSTRESRSPLRLRMSWFVSPNLSTVSRVLPESSLMELALANVLFAPPENERLTPSLTTMLPKKLACTLMIFTWPTSFPLLT